MAMTFKVTEKVTPSTDMDAPNFVGEVTFSEVGGSGNVIKFTGLDCGSSTQATAVSNLETWIGVVKTAVQTAIGS